MSLNVIGQFVQATHSVGSSVIVEGERTPSHMQAYIFQPRFGTETRAEHLILPISFISEDWLRITQTQTFSRKNGNVIPYGCVRCFSAVLE